MEEGWIKLFRQFTQWEWYSDVNASRIFLHLVLTANHKDSYWKNILIKRGQRLTSIEHLANEVNLTVQQVRTGLKKLISTNEITIKSTNKYSLITIEKYAFYQDTIDNDNKQDNKQTNKPITTNNNRLDYILNNKINILNIVREKILETGCWITDKKLNEKFEDMLKYSPDNPEEYLFKSLMKEVEE